MSKRTISNLSREIKVSRPTIYKKIAELGIDKKTEYPIDEYEAIKKSLVIMSDMSKQKKVDIENVKASEASTFRKMLAPEIKNAESEIIRDDKSTMRERLRNAKQEYDYNRSLIIKFQMDTENFISENHTTSIGTHNGTLTPIPSITSLEKYVKLNIILSKLISDLESDLDLTEDDAEDDPCS